MININIKLLEEKEVKCSCNSCLNCYENNLRRIVLNCDVGTDTDLLKEFKFNLSQVKKFYGKDLNLKYLYTLLFFKGLDNRQKKDIRRKANKILRKINLIIEKEKTIKAYSWKKKVYIKSIKEMNEEEKIKYWKNLKINDIRHGTALDSLKTTGYKENIIKVIKGDY